MRKWPYSLFLIARHKIKLEFLKEGNDMNGNHSGSIKLSKRMIEAIELLEQEEFYLCEFQTWSFWRAYNLKGKTIRTDTMKALERRGIVKIEFAVGEKRSDYMAKLKK